MKQIIKLTATLLCTLLTLVHYGQSTLPSVSGSVVSAKKPVEAATVQLFNLSDSTLVRSAITETTGKFTLSNLQPGKYYVQYSAVGFQKSYSAAITLSGNNNHLQLDPVEIKTEAKALQAVVVTSKKQMIEQKLDRTVLNVDASPTNAGLTALEVLEKSPGVMVDKDGNISLKGKQGVVIMMDGKPTYLSSSDIANLLKNMPASQIEQIEIMTNPPAKFDAAGNSGIINIKTKKTKTVGFNGSINIGAGYAKNPRTNNSINLNYRTGKFNFFTNYSHNWNKQSQNLTIKRVFPDTLFNQQSNMTPNFQTHTLKVGADYFVDKKTTVGVVLTGFSNPGTLKNNNTTFKTDYAGNIFSRTVTLSNIDQQWQNRGVNVNFRKTIDSTGRELSADVDYLRYRSTNLQNFESNFFDREGSKNQVDEFLKGNLPSVISIYSAKVDYVHPLKNNAKIEAGVKSSIVKTDNDAQYSNLVSGLWKIDQERSNHFVYNENINAAYVNGSKEFNKKWSGQLGLRLENTNATGNQITINQLFKRNYTQLFPTAYVGYKLNDNNQFALSYGRRIQRPDYEDMNPFFFFLDKYTYQVGNPYLRPQFSHNVEINHSFKGFLNTSIGYSRTKDIIQQVLEQIDSTSTSFVKQSNIARQNNLNLSVNANVPVTKWWRANLYLNVFHNKFTGIVNNGPIDVQGVAGVTNITNSFTFKKGWGAELSGWYRSKAIEGTLVSNPMGAMNVAFTKQVLKNKGTLMLNVRDVLYTQKFNGYSRYQNIDVTIRNVRDSRVVNLSFNYRFGKPYKAPQRKKGGAGDEQSRVKAGSN